MNLSSSTPMLAADPALPQRDLLLDEAVMKEYLSHLLARNGDCGIEECERLRTKYRIGTSLRVLYEVAGNCRSYRIAARAFPRTRHVTNSFSSSSEINAPELNTTFWIFPHDRKIKQLSALNQIPTELRYVAGQTWTKSRIVGHAPEKSVTAQCLAENNQVLAYAKVYAGDEGRDFFNTYVHLADESPKQNLHVPRALGYFEKHHLLMLEAVAGFSLSTLAPAQRGDAFFQLGRALRALHATAPPASLPQSARFTPEALARTAATIGEARPDVATLVQQLSHKLIAQHAMYSGGEHVFLHGDLHPKNILLDRERLFLLDFDQAARGIAAVDLGSVIAGLHCDACIGSLTWREASSLTHAILAGYGSLSAFGTLESIRWHVAAALLHERALRAVTRIRPRVLDKLPQLLQIAEAVLNGGIDAN
ncbi:MAG TPA: phosphotransferase [Pyrinomonadaceae bacterium]